MKKKLVCLTLCLAMFVSQSSVFATTQEQVLRNQRDQASNQLNSKNNQLENLTDQQKQIKSEINILDADLLDLMVKIDENKSDIANTEAQIEVTKQNLQAAEGEKSKQYEAMKKRIQYLYEEGGDMGWVNMLMGAENITELLNKAEFTQKMYDYDRKQLEKYAAAVEEVKNLKAQLESQKTSLEAMKADLESQQAQLQVQLEQKKATSSNYEAEIANVQRQAAEIRALISQQTAQINRLEAERIAAERAAAERAAAERAAAERAAAQRAAQQEAARREQESRAAASESSSSSSRRSSAPAQETAVEEVRQSSPASTSGKKKTSSSESATGSSSGAGIVAFADQYIGYPYVWGGNSLTGGIDCSHFVYQVLTRCGVYSGGYETSAGWRTLGSPVASLSEARAGDVICYSGHVAIYDGNGGIVEAKGSKYGITHDRRADHGTILAIRRFT